MSDWTITTTANFDAGKKNDIATDTDEYTHTADQLQLSFPYADKDANLISYWRLGSVTDETGNYNGTITGTVTQTDGVFDNTKAYAFGGTDDYITYGAAANWIWMHYNVGNDFTWTFSYWMRLSNCEWNGIYSIGGTSNVSSAGRGVMFAIDDRGAYSIDKECRQWVTRGVSGQMVCSDLYADHVDYPDTDNVWINVITTYDQGLGTNNMKVYVNSVLQTQRTKNAYAPANADPDGAFMLGTNPALTYDYPEDLCEVKVYDRVLNQTQITALYNSAKKYTSTGNWRSASQTMTAGYKMLNVVITHSGLDATEYIDKVEILDASDNSVLSTYDTNIITGASTTLVDGDFDNGLGVTADTNFKVKLYLVGDQSLTPVITQVEGDFVSSAVAGDEGNFSKVCRIDSLNISKQAWIEVPA